MTMLRQFLDAEDGATAIEYGLIATLVSVAIMVGVGYFADALQGMWSDNNGKIVPVLHGEN